MQLKRAAREPTGPLVTGGEPMRKTLFAIPLCAAGLFLSSCVTAPVPKAPVAELFDSTAVPSSAREPPADRSPLPEPSLAGLPAGPVPAPSTVAAGSLLAGSVARPVPDAVSAASAAVPARAKPALPDWPGLISLPPPKAVKFQLAAPAAPPVEPRKQAAPPARQTKPHAPLSRLKH